MTCPRCATDDAGRGMRFCATCEREYDGWSRRHATDIAWEVLSGMVIVLAFGMGLPLLGASWLTAAGGIFAGFATILGVHRINQRRRRRQFLSAGGIPRAYLPSRS